MNVPFPSLCVQSVCTGMWDVHGGQRSSLRARPHLHLVCWCQGKVTCLTNFQEFSWLSSPNSCKMLSLHTHIALYRALWGCYRFESRPLNLHGKPSLQLIYIFSTTILKLARCLYLNFYIYMIKSYKNKTWCL